MGLEGTFSSYLFVLFGASGGPCFFPSQYVFSFNLDTIKLIGGLREEAPLARPLLGLILPGW